MLTEQEKTWLTANLSFIFTNLGGGKETTNLLPCLTALQIFWFRSFCEEKAFRLHGLFFLNLTAS